jgi:hypothetical protein
VQSLHVEDEVGTQGQCVLGDHNEHAIFAWPQHTSDIVEPQARDVVPDG